jgi:DNA-binding transcriptional LysR family regulator
MPTSLNLNTFRIFLTVHELQSMTAAAAVLHLTQSGVSQHIKALEAELGFPLFERVGKKLFPTAKATQLYRRGRKGLAEIEMAVREVGHLEERAEGLVRVGMPVEYGTSHAIPELARLGKKYPGLDFDITLDFATTLSAMVLRGELDFALIDHFRVDPSLKMETVGEEHLLLCALKSYVKGFGPVKNHSSYFSQLHYVDYQKGEPIVRSWFRHHLGRHNLEIRVRGRVFDVQGISRFICEGLGAGVLPQAVVERLKAEGVDLHVFEGKKAPLKNEICLIQLPLKERPLHLKLALECVRKGL